MKKQKYINVEDFQQDNYPYTFIIGARGVGKTISSLKDKIKRYYQSGEMFIYLRRSQTEIETTNFNIQLLDKLTGLKITRGKLGEGRNKPECLFVNGQPVAYLLALSTAAKFKSNDYSNVAEIVYDEFIDARGRELKNETKLFLNFAMTVFRDFTKFKALFLANATNLYNCYFLDLEVMPTKRITKFSKLGIKIVMYQMSDELFHEHANSYLGRLVEHVEGENGSSLHNDFDNAYNDFLVSLSNKARYYATLKLNGELYGLYNDEGAFVITNKVDNSFNRKYAVTLGDTADEYPNVDYKFIQQLISNFKATTLFFTDVKSRSNWIRFFKAPYSAGR